MFGKAFLCLGVAPHLVLGQVQGCSTSDTCFTSGPNDVNFTQAHLVIPNACVSLAGSYIHDEQRHYCAVCGPSPSKFDFVIRRTGDGTGSVDAGTCKTNMKALLQGSQCGGAAWEWISGWDQHGGRFTSGDFNYLAYPNYGMCSDLRAAPKVPVCAI